MISLNSTCSDTYRIADALKTAASKLGVELENKKAFDFEISEGNRPDKHPTISNKWFASQLNGKPIIYYLNHSKIDIYAKMFYQGQFAVSDDALTFAFLNNVLTCNHETKAFYLHVFNSVLRVTDGALSESMGAECRAYLQNYPCDFIKIKDNKLYADNYKKWIDFAAVEYYCEQNPIAVINKNIDLIKQKVLSNCANKIGELENVRNKLIEFVKENE